jgi:UTP--glucose-1-phosphate uridylyltransferase
VQRSGVLDQLFERGVKIVQVSNEDNLGARIDPAVIGAHVLSAATMSVEVARKEGDAGGAPARVDGRLTLLESPRFPPGFDADAIPVFNTNTATFDVDVLAGEYELTWLHVTKEVGGRPVVQLERLYHEVASFVEAQFLVVPRSGPRGRFFPIKTPEDLTTRAGDLREMLETPLV